MTTSTTEPGAMVKVWDPVVRIGHWVLVATFAVAYLTEGEPEWLHTWAGYAIAATVALRVVWGFVGPRRARFSDFVTGPGQVIAYLTALISGRSERHIGHSPAGGAMTVALLACLAVTAFTGMGTLASKEGEGPLAGIVAKSVEVEPAASTRPEGESDEHEGREEGEGGAWKEVHEVFANLSLFLIVLHLGGVLLASTVHRENLARSMVNGFKRP